MNDLWPDYYRELADKLANGERAALHPQYQPLGAAVARELAQARAHVERAAKLSGVDTGAYPRVAHGGADLRERRPADPTCAVCAGKTHCEQPEGC